MGRSRLIPYIVHYITNVGFITPGEYRTSPKFDGRPSTAGLAKHVAMLNESLRPGGVNYYPSHHGQQVISAALVNQRTGDVIATWSA